MPFGNDLFPRCFPGGHRIVNSRLGRGILLVLLTGIALLLAASANAQPSGDVLNLAGSDASCLRDPAQLSDRQRERAMLSDRAHRPLAIIALSRDDAEPLTRLGQSPLQICEACGSSTDIWVCIGDLSAVRQALAQAQRLRELQRVAAQWRASDSNSAQAFFYSALAAENLGDEKIALSYYGQAVALNPQLGAAQLSYARCLMRDGAYQQA